MVITSAFPQKVNIIIIIGSERLLVAPQSSLFCKEEQWLYFQATGGFSGF